MGCNRTHAAGAVVVSAPLLALVAMTASAVALAQDIEIKERTVYYAVQGTSASQLGAQMATRGPADRFGRRAWGFTAWEVRTTYALTPTDRGCVIEQPHAHVDIVTTLPVWRKSAGASWPLRSRWRKMLVSLIRHEATHREHALLAARTATAELERTPVQPTCGDAETRARQVLRAAVLQSRRLSLEFDRDTRHGARQGVRLDAGD